MNKLFLYISNRHSQIYKGFIFAATVTLMVYLFPREGKFKYEYQKGKPWQHENLYAPFDFAVKKPQEELEKQREEVIQNSRLFFQLDTAKKTAAIKDFTRELDDEWSEDVANIPGLQNFLKRKSIKQEQLDALKKQHVKTGVELIKHVYQRGIIEPHDAIEGKEDITVSVVKNNIAEEHDVSEYYTPNSAFQYVKEQLASKPNINSEFLSGLLIDVIDYNIYFDKSLTDQMLNEALKSIPETRGVIREGTRIISQGDIVDQERFQRLESLRQEKEKQLGQSGNYYYILSGQIILISLVLLMLFLFLGVFRKDLYDNNRNINFFLLLIILMVFLASMAVRYDLFHVYILPYCIIPIIVRTLFDTRLALFAHLINVLIIGFLAPNGFEFVFLQLIAGNVAIFSLIDLRHRSQLFISSIYVFLAYSISYLGITLIQEGDLGGVNMRYFAWFGVSALLTLPAIYLIYLFEKMFGFVSEVKLMELMDTNSPLLRDLAVKAPGTFQHSLQVANLAEEAIHEIGGSTMLVRTGALYHDIGKMENPVFFIENQITGVNPHDELTPEESARIIIRHVIHGIELAKKADIPDLVVDFIRTHHGTTKTQYFYQQFKKEHPDDDVDDDMFQYPGPLPYSKETAVLMMADSVEASSKSLKQHTAENISILVDSIIDGLMGRDQFVNSNITFRDITRIKKIFKKKLMSIYHVRVEYPE